MERATIKPKQPTPEQGKGQSESLLDKDLAHVRSLHADGYVNLIIIGIADPDENSMKLYFNQESHPLEIAQALQNAIDELYDSTGAVPGAK